MYAKRIAERVKRIRLQKEMTQEVLAIRAGLTKGYVSLLESGKKVPAISTLYRLATALGVGLGDFFEEAKDTPEIVITRNGEGVRISSKNSFGYEYEALATGKTDKFMDPFFVSVSPGKKGNEFVHKGQEFMYVIEGALKLTYKGKEHILNPEIARISNPARAINWKHTMKSRFEFSASIQTVLGVFQV